MSDNHNDSEDDMMDSKPAAVDYQEDEMVDLEEQLPEDNVDHDNMYAEDYVEDPAEDVDDGEAGGYGEITEDVEQPSDDVYEDMAPPTSAPKLKDPPPPQHEMMDNSTEEMMKLAPVYEEEPVMPKLKDPPPPPPEVVDDSTEEMMKPAPLYDEEFEMPKLKDPPPALPEMTDDDTEGMMKPAPVNDDAAVPTKPMSVLDVIAMQEAMLAGKPETALIPDAVPSQGDIDPTSDSDAVAKMEGMKGLKPEAASMPGPVHSQGDLDPIPDPDAAAKMEAMKGRKPEAASTPGPVHSQPQADPSTNIVAKESDGNEDDWESPLNVGGGGGNPEELKDQKKTGSKREINPDFQDLQKTGKWGSISKIEMMGVAIVAALIVIIVIVVLAVVLTRDNTSVETVPPFTAAPTPMATPVPPEEKLAFLLAALDNNNVTSQLLVNETMPDIPNFYFGLLESEDCTQVPHQCAMSWSLFEDEFPPTTDDIVHRFGMAAFYFSLGGDNWVNNTNWLTTSSYCDWHGINCNRGETIIEEIMLDDSNLEGKLPLSLALVDTLAVISLKGNAIGGNLPGGVFASMPELFLLYLQNNLFTGTIPSNLHDNGQLAILFIQENSFTGPYPLNYCTGGPQGPIFREFGLDCDTNTCPATCCLSSNCY